MTSIVIPNSVTSIGSYAFASCTGLTKVIASDIGAWCGISFYNTYSNPLYYARHLYSDADTEITSLVIPSSVTSVGRYAFYDCTGLISIDIPASVTSIGSEAFDYCTNISRVNISDLTAWMRIKFENNRSNPTWYAKSLHLNGKAVTAVVVPEEITAIGDFAFKQVETLQTITMHDGITSIGQNAFQGCFNLQSFHLPASLTTIGNGAFHQCTSLDQPLDLSKTRVDSVPDVAFYMCYKLPAVTLPANLRYLGERSFGTDTCLVSVTSLVEDPSALMPTRYTRLPFHCFNTNGYVVDNQVIYHKATLYVPKGTADAYRQSVAFAGFQNIVEMEDNTGIDSPTIADTSGSGSRSATWYTLGGQRVSSPGKGLYILRSTEEAQGSKVYVK